MVDLGNVTFSLLCARCHAVEKMARNSNALKRDGSVMADSDLVDSLSRSTDSAINFEWMGRFTYPYSPPFPHIQYHVHQLHIEQCYYVSKPSWF